MTLKDVQDLFMPNTRNALPKQSLRTFYLSCFGGVQSGVSRMSDFEGKFTASFFEFSGSADEDGVFTGTFSFFSTGGLSTNYMLEIQEQNNQPAPDPNAWDFLIGSQSVIGSTTSLSVALDSGDYFIRGIVYNGLNSHPDDRVDRGYVEVSIQSAPPPVFSTPAINSCQTDGFLITAEWNYGDTPTNFEAQVRVGNGTWEVGSLQLGSDTNWGTASNPKSGSWSGSQFLDPGEVHKVRIRASASGLTGASDWSPECSVTF